MKKAIATALLLALLAVGCAYADSVPSISSDLFADAKDALSLLAEGDYERVADMLPFSGEAPSAADWEALAGDLSTLDPDTVQREVSVAFWGQGSWYLAVPVTAPDSGSVEALVFSSPDGETFSDYRAMRWDAVEKGYAASDYVKWNKEYVSGTPIIIGD